MAVLRIAILSSHASYVSRAVQILSIYGIKITLIHLLKRIRNVHVKYIYRKNIIMQEELDQNLR